MERFLWNPLEFGIAAGQPAGSELWVLGFSVSLRPSYLIALIFSSHPALNSRSAFGLPAKLAIYFFAFYLLQSDHSFKTIHDRERTQTMRRWLLLGSAKITSLFRTFTNHHLLTHEGKAVRASPFDMHPELPDSVVDYHCRRSEICSGLKTVQPVNGSDKPLQW